MRMAQIALVTAVVIVGLLGYTKTGHRILYEIGLPKRLQAWLRVLGSKAG